MMMIGHQALQVKAVENGSLLKAFPCLSSPFHTAEAVLMARVEESGIFLFLILDISFYFWECGFCIRIGVSILVIVRIRGLFI